MVKYARNKRKFKYADDNSSASKKCVKIRKKKTAYFIKNSFQSCASSQTDIFLEIFGSSEINPKKTKHFEDKGEFSSIKLFTSIMFMLLLIF